MEWLLPSPPSHALLHTSTDKTAASHLGQPELSGIRVTGLELLPGLVSLGNDLLGLGGVEVLLVEAESVEGLVVGGLVPPEPLPDAILHGVGDVADVVVLLGEVVVGGDGDDLRS